MIYERIFHWKFAKRPNCNKTLVEKHLWALGLHEFEVENELRTQKVNNKNENGRISAMQAAEIPIWKVPNGASKIPKHI